MPKLEVIEIGDVHAMPPVIVERINVARHAQIHEEDIAVGHGDTHSLCHDGSGGVDGAEHDVGSLQNIG